MKRAQNNLLKNLLLAAFVAVIGRIFLSLTKRTGLVDISIEAILFFIGSLIAFIGYAKSKKTLNKNFRRFELFYGITYLTAVVSFIIGIYYYIKNPNVIEIGISDIMDNNYLIAMSAIKSFTMIFLIFTWVSFYRYLNIKATTAKKILIFLLGFALYFGMSILIWHLTGDVNVLSLGIIVGIVIGIFALIAVDRRTIYLTVIFTVYSSIHLIEFYMMGMGKDLTSGINNHVYWFVTVLYVLEVKRWISNELITNAKG